MAELALILGVIGFICLLVLLWAMLTISKEADEKARRDYLREREYNAGDRDPMRWNRRRML